MDTLTDPAQPSATPFFATGKRSRDLAAELGLSEAELLAAHDGPEVVRLALEAEALVNALPALGEIMVLTRNDVAVHEKVGRFGGIRFGKEAGLVINPPLDLRLFPKAWASAFAVEIPGEGEPRRSIQIFDRAGHAALKIHLRPASDVAAFEALRARFAITERAQIVAHGDRHAVVDGEHRHADAQLVLVGEFVPLQAERIAVSAFGAVQDPAHRPLVRVGAPDVVHGRLLGLGHAARTSGGGRMERATSGTTMSASASRSRPASMRPCPSCASSAASMRSVRRMPATRRSRGQRPA